MPVSPRSPAVKGVGCSRVGISTMELAGTGFGLPRLIPIPAHLHTLKPAHSPWTTYFHSHTRAHTPYSLSAQPASATTFLSLPPSPPGHRTVRWTVGQGRGPGSQQS